MFRRHAPNNIYPIPEKFTLEDLQRIYQNARDDKGLLCLMVAPPDVFDRLWVRVQPEARWTPGTPSNPLSASGHYVVAFNRIDVIRHRKCPPDQLLFFSVGEVVDKLLEPYDEPPE